MKVLVAQLCPTVCDTMDCSPLGSSVHGILQARILEGVAIPFSTGSSRPRDWTHVSCTAGRFFTVWAIRVSIDVISKTKRASQVALVIKNPPANSGDTGHASWIPGSEGSPGEGNGDPLQDSCPENPVDWGAWGLQSTGLQGVGHDWSHSARKTKVQKPEPLLGRGHVSDLGPADELNGRNSVTSKVILLDMDSGRYGACQSLAGKRGQLLSGYGVLLGDYVGSVWASDFMIDGIKTIHK